MNAILVILLVIGGIIVFFIPVIVGKATGSHIEHVKGRTYAIFKDKEFIDTAEGKALQNIVIQLDVMGFGPYSRFGINKIKTDMSQLPEHMRTLRYTDENIKIMLNWIGLEENEHTRRVKKQQPGIGFSISGSM